jgi:endoribonuclease Nob1
MILDTSAFVAGLDPFSIREDMIAPPSVEEEVKRNTMTKLRLATAIEGGRLKIISPNVKFMNQVEACATSLGDTFYLSETDKQVLALALEAKARGETPHIVTDDYSIQNVATKLGLSYMALATLGIKRVLTWIRYCPACYKTYPASSKAKECSICGTELKRKPQRPAKEPQKQQ